MPHADSTEQARADAGHPSPHAGRISALRQLLILAGAPLAWSVQIALGCVDAVPVLLPPTRSDENSVRQAVEEAALDPPSDVHASADYRRHLAATCAVRAVEQARERGK